MNDFSSLIQQIYPVSPIGVELVRRYLTIQTLSRGEMLFMQGEVNDNFYIVRKGMMRFFHVENEKDHTICFAGRGDAVASLHSYMRGEPSICNMEALTKVELFKFSKRDFEKMTAASAELANWVRTLAFTELFTLERRYSYVGTGDAYARYKAFMQMRPQEDIQKIPLKYIASYLGITPQTLSRMRRIYAHE